MSCLLIIVLLILFLFFCKKRKNEPYIQSQITILDNNQIKNFIVQDKDNFLNSLTPFDLSARKVNSLENYKNIILNDINYDLSEHVKDLIKNTARKADQLLSKDYKFLSDLEWNFAIINNRNYEGGYPHTRSDIIFIFPWIFDLPKDKLIRIFIHEKFHILQRNYPDNNIVKNYMKNYNIIEKRDNLLKIEPLLRANPDLDEFIYKNKEGIIMYSIYSNKEPTHIGDTNNNSKEEHPYEKMAYELSSKLI